MKKEWGTPTVKAYNLVEVTLLGGRGGRGGGGRGGRRGGRAQS